MKNFLLLALVLTAFNVLAAAQSPISVDLLTSGQAKEEKRDHEGALADYERLIRLTSYTTSNNRDLFRRGGAWT